MTPGMIPRHHDYVLGPNQDARLASVAAGKLIEGLTLGLDTDAPFILRSRAMRVSYQDNTHAQFGLNTLMLRWAGPNRDYRSQDLIRQSLLGPYFGQLGNPIPVNPPVVYPRQGAITVDILNDGANALTNLTLYFRGVKLFAPDAVKSYRYPARFGLLPYTYSRTVKNLAVTSAPIRHTLKVKPDADFVLRAGQAGLPFAATPVNEIFITFRDEDEKPYSNDGVHIDVMFGNAGFASAAGNAVYQSGPSYVPPVGTGPNLPGLFFPEIYVAKNHVLYYDVSRADAAYGGAVAVNYPIALIGQKVFVK